MADEAAADAERLSRPVSGGARGARAPRARRPRPGRHLARARGRGDRALRRRARPARRPRRRQDRRPLPRGAPVDPDAACDAGAGRHRPAPDLRAAAPDEGRRADGRSVREHRQGDPDQRQRAAQGRQILRDILTMGDARALARAPGQARLRGTATSSSPGTSSARTTSSTTSTRPSSGARSRSATTTTCASGRRRCCSSPGRSSGSATTPSTSASRSSSSSPASSASSRTRRIRRAARNRQPRPLSELVGACGG